MESPIRRYQRTKDYQRHKLFRKMKRRRNAQIESVKDAPVRKLRRKLGIPKFAEGVRNLRFVGNDGRIVDDLGNDMLVLHDAEDGYGDDPSKWVYINDRTGETYTPYVPTDNGTIQQKGRWSALSRLEALSNPYRTDPVLGAPARLIGALKGNNAIDMSIFDVIGAVAPFVGASTLKFSKPLTQQKMRNMTLRQLGEYFEANPHLLKDIEVTLNVRNFYNNDVLPRLAKQTKRPVGFTADDLINQFKFKAGNFGESNYGGYYSPGDNSIILNDKYLNNPRMLDRILMHEISHGMYNRAGYTPEAASKLQAAYRFSPEYLAAHPEIQQLAEQSAVNTETRGMLSMDNGWLFGKPLDDIIKNMDNPSLMKYYTGDGASTYAKDWSKQFLPGMMLLKGALTGVAGTIPFILSKDSIGYKDGKLPVYYTGINPWGDTEEQQAVRLWANDWKTRTTAAGGSKVLQQWNATGSKPKPESSQLYTKRRVAEEQKRTWLSDAADIAEGIKDAALSMTPYTALPYFGAKVGLDMLNGNIGAQTALNAAFATAPFMPKFTLPQPVKNTINKVGKYVSNIVASPAAKRMMEYTDNVFPDSYQGFSNPYKGFPDPYQGLYDFGVDNNVQLIKNLPKFSKYGIFKNLSDTQKLNALFEKKIDNVTGISYYVPKQQYKDKIKLEKLKYSDDIPFGYEFMTDDGFNAYVSLREPNVNKTNIVFSAEPSRAQLDNMIWRDVNELDTGSGVKRMYEAEEFYDKLLPRIYELEDSWKLHGMQGPKPKLYSTKEWDSMTDEGKFIKLFDIHVDKNTGFRYYMPKPYLRKYFKEGGSSFYNVGLKNDKYGDLLLGDYPKSTIGKVIMDKSELPALLGYERFPNKHKIIKPTLPEEDLDWSWWRMNVAENIDYDWKHNGPLSSHLIRSGIDNPFDLLDYMLSPEQAWKLTLSKPKSINDAWFKTVNINHALENNEFSNAFVKELNGILKENGLTHKPLSIQDLTSYNIKNTLRDVLRLNDKLSPEEIILKLVDTAKTGKASTVRPNENDIFEESFNRTLKNNKDLARQFYEMVEDSYDNAFASPAKGTMFISPKRKNFAKVVSHEFGHLEDVSPGSYEMPGVVESNQLSVRPTGDTPLFKKAFDLSGISGDLRNYFIDNDAKNATEMALRATQIADYLKLKPGEPITPEKLKYAMEHMVDDTGHDNSMTEFFSTIKDIDAAAKWMTVFHKAIVPAIATGTVTNKLLKKPKRNNTQNELRNK